MTRNNGNEIVAALDIGTSKILALVAEINDENELKVIGFGSEPSGGLKKGVVVNIEATVYSIDQAIREAERVAGCEINTVFAGIAGSHIRSFDGHGIVRINDGEVSQEDINGVIDASQAMNIPSDQRILHVLPKDFVIDGQEGIREPIGMSGVRLEADVHIVTVSRSAEQNIIKSMDRCGLEVQQIVLEQLASSFSVLSDDEKDLGVCLVDIGGGTSDIVVFMDGQIVATKVIPVGGNHVTNDIAYALRTPENEAEEIKIKHACTISKMINKEELIEVPSVGNRSPRKIELERLASVVQARYEELFAVIDDEIGKMNIEKLRAGVVLTGGTSQLNGAKELAEEILETDIRVGFPKDINGTFENINSPIHSTGAGLLLFALDKYKNNPDDLVKQKALESPWVRVKSWLNSNL
ncbi:MAG: cell division protein FtsA [Gammaproteobacteria bacterium]|nr:MAG: cell division protein FtsA [Gammaproteobacteria bacterium]